MKASKDTSVVRDGLFAVLRPIARVRVHLCITTQTDGLSEVQRGYRRLGEHQALTGYLEHTETGMKVEEG